MNDNAETIHTRHRNRAVSRAVGLVLALAISLMVGVTGASRADAAAGSDHLYPGEVLHSGESLSSATTGYVMRMQDDGNLVVIAPGNRPVWQAGTSGHPGAFLGNQGDGNLVVYTPDIQALWNSHTDGHPGGVLTMQDDGNAVMVAPGNVPVWASNTRVETGPTPPAGPTQASARAEAAISWFQARMGSAGFEGRCEQAVRLAYANPHRYRSALQDWAARPDKHSDIQNAPRGALVFYRTSASGHVAISLGNGQVISTSVRHRIGVVPVWYFQRPLGWAAGPG